MLVKEKFYRPVLLKKIIFIIYIISISLFSLKGANANLQKELINNITATKTLSFSFKQKIAQTVEIGNCFIKYPLLMKCDYKNLKQSELILSLIMEVLPEQALLNFLMGV